MYRVRYTVGARNDLVEIWDYIAEDDVTAADGFVFALRTLCERLADMPLMGRAREELAPNLRSLPHERYTIFYRPCRDGIQVIRVLHSARDVDALFEEN